MRSCALGYGRLRRYARRSPIPPIPPILPVPPRLRVQPERDVVRERVGKQERLLRDETDRAPERGQRDLAHVDPVDEHRPRRRIVQPREQRVSVDFPEPVTPTSATVCPASIVAETCLSTGVSP